MCKNISIVARMLNDGLIHFAPPCEFENVMRSDMKIFINRIYYEEAVYVSKGMK